MARVLLDSDVFIHHLRGVSAAQRYLSQRLASDEPAFYSVVTRAELLAGTVEGEEATVLQLLDHFKEVTVDRTVAERAGRYRQQYGPSHGVLLPDALIAASAALHEAVLVTCNVEHFPMRDLHVERPYQKR